MYVCFVRWGTRLLFFLGDFCFLYFVVVEMLMDTLLLLKAASVTNKYVRFSKRNNLLGYTEDLKRIDIKVISNFVTLYVPTLSLKITSIYILSFYKHDWFELMDSSWTTSTPRH